MVKIFERNSKKKQLEKDKYIYRSRNIKRTTDILESPRVYRVRSLRARRASLPFIFAVRGRPDFQLVRLVLPIRATTPRIFSVSLPRDPKDFSAKYRSPAVIGFVSCESNLSAPNIFVSFFLISCTVFKNLKSRKNHYEPSP